MKANKSITAIKGVLVGHCTNNDKLSGCTVVVFDKPCNVAYVGNGGSTRVYDANILGAGKSYFLKHAIFIADGAHAGLESASEIIKALREKEIGFHMNKSVNPSITGATVMSLGLNIAPYDSRNGYLAVQNINNSTVDCGNVGAGTGTSVGKFSWTNNGKCLAMKSGVGSSYIDLGHGGIISALTVTNALGNVINRDGSVLAGNRNDKEEPRFRSFEGFSNFLTDNFSNTTISIVGTNIRVTNMEDLRKITEVATHGQIRAINPVNTSLDGDSVFVFSTQELDLNLNDFGEEIGNDQGDWWKLKVDMLGQFAAKAVQESIYDSCLKAETIKYDLGYKGVIPSSKEY
jgi:L-aminopeptidase/D-esterase-like protein